MVSFIFYFMLYYYHNKYLTIIKNLHVFSYVFSFYNKNGVTVQGWCDNNSNSRTTIESGVGGVEKKSGGAMKKANEITMKKKNWVST